VRSTDIRDTFLDYFRSQDHTVIGSSSLLPGDDPTLLFTNAGMVQFKSVFTGEESRSYNRAVSCQKCMRAGGKHNDIENVGHTARHHTFFEMLGNFSFGDYFKKEAVIFAWELLTKAYHLPDDKLWVSVYEEDDEALKLWIDNTAMPGERIIKLGAKDNFWQMGDTGPCGPCSEILIDQGEETGCGKEDCAAGCDCDRYLEIWNLVFMQYNRDSDGTLTPLPKPSIDTGMGLERITAVLQGKKNNFDTDLFSTIISSICAATGAQYHTSDDTDVSIRVIADHIRASTFLLSEGLIPSNEGRGYVLRRVIRRASRHARLLGIEDPVLFNIVDSVIESMGTIYPEIVDERERTRKILRIEEERFIKTLQQGINKIDAIIEEMRRSGSDTIDGEELFRLYDTYGFPLDLVRDIAVDSGIKIDENGFNKAMEEQRERARASWVAEDTRSSGIYKKLQEKYGDTEFTGYDSLESSSRIVSMIKDGAEVNEITEGDQAEIVLNTSPFYGESGGQVGDTGSITGDNAKMTVVGTIKPVGGLHIHKTKVRRGTFRSGDPVTCDVDVNRRKAIMRNHTATHLLHASLRNVLGEHVKQSGSLVSDDRLRFDFTHFHGLDAGEKEEIERLVNSVVIDDKPVHTDISSIDEAVSSGAMALFDEKYGDTVRVVSVEGVSKELCGGTHCSATGEIGPFVITSEGSVAAGIRRIEAITGLAAIDYLNQRDSDMNALSAILKTDNPVEKVQRVLEEVKTLKKEIEQLKTSVTASKGVDPTDSAKVVNDTKVLVLRKDGLSGNELRTLSDNLKDKLRSGIVLIASVNDNQASILCSLTKDIANKYHAGDILKKVVSECGGRGGGKSHMAQGGTKEIDKLDKALDMVYDIVKEAA
jgi:alanyl-tRNA synthetase